MTLEEQVHDARTKLAEAHQKRQENPAEYVAETIGALWALVEAIARAVDALSQFGSNGL